MKRGEINTNFQKRYFVLREGRLSYYEDPKEQSPKGTISLPDTKLQVDGHEIRLITYVVVYYSTEAITSF